MSEAIENFIEYCDRRIAEIDRSSPPIAERSWWDGLRTGFIRCRDAAIREMDVRQRSAPSDQEERADV